MKTSYVFKSKLEDKKASLCKNLLKVLTGDAQLIELMSSGNRSEVLTMRGALLDYTEFKRIRDAFKPLEFKWTTQQVGDLYKGYLMVLK